MELRPSLAWCELYLIFATIFQRYHVTIHDTTDEDMEFMDYALILLVDLWLYPPYIALY